MKNPNNDRKDQVGAGRRPVGSAFARIERVPPLLMFLYLGLVGITVLFAALVVLYALTRARHGEASGLHPFPRYFSLSTIVLLVSSYTVAQAPRLYRADDLPGLVRCLVATGLLACVFCGLQGLGWRELLQQGVFFRGSPSGTYVYLISGLHVAHVLAGMVFLLAVLLRAVHAARDGVRELVYIRNPYHRRQLRMLTTYWHFVDALWVALFGAFLFLY